MAKPAVGADAQTLATDSAAGPVALDQPLGVWTLATVNTVVFVLALLVPSYASGGLSDVLPNLGTVVGLAVFGYLWLVVWATTRWLLGRVDLPSESPLRLALWAGTLGAVDGIAFLVGVVLGLGLPTALFGGLQLVTIALLALFGTPVAAVFGAVVGVAALTLDLGLLWAADAVSPAPVRQ